MSSLGQPKRIGTLVLVLATLIVGAALPAGAVAASPEGSGPLMASPEPIALASTTVGFQSQAQEVTLTYLGSGEVGIQKVSIQGEDADDFYFNWSSCGWLGEGGSCEAWLGMKPGSAGLKQALLVVDYQNERAPDSFAISGLAVEPSLSFAPASHDFGLQRINREASSYEFQVQNTGEAGVQASYFDIGGSGQEAFWVESQGCGHWLEPGESCPVQVRFNPHERQAYEAEVRAWVNGSVFTAAIEGEGGAAVIEALQNPVGFGGATVGSAGPVRTITLRNSGDLPEFFFIGVLAGGDAASFRLLDEGCTLIELGPGDTCSAHVRFNPESAGPKAARLAFFGDGDGGTLVQVEGTGIAAAATLLPSGFDFGAVAPGARGVAHQFLVRNEGAAPLALDRVTIAGADVDQFALSGDECTGAELAPGAECAVRVRFAPDETGAKRATLRASGPSGILTSALAGTGAAPAPVVPTTSLPPAEHGSRHRSFVRGKTLDARDARFLNRKGKKRSSGKHRRDRRHGAKQARRRSRR
jgi:hypothetical protein